MVGRKILPVLILISGILSFALIAWLGFEFGRYQAGYSLLDVRRDTEQADAQIAAQAGAIEELERQIAILETAREIDREAYASVEANLDALEQQIVDQQEELRFYQGIVSPEDGTAGLRIQDFEVVSGTGERSYTVRVVLVQAMVHNERVSGSVVLTLNGLANGELVALDLASLAGEELADGIHYGFRYFQAVEFPLTLPPGFVAESVDVEVIPERQQGSTWTQNFVWPG
jgi:cell division protein FtsL